MGVTRLLDGNGLATYGKNNDIRFSFLYGLSDTGTGDREVT